MVPKRLSKILDFTPHFEDSQLHGIPATAKVDIDGTRTDFRKLTALVLELGFRGLER